MKSIIFSISRAIEFSNPIDYQNTMNFFNFLDSINMIIKYTRIIIRLLFDSL